MLTLQGDNQNLLIKYSVNVCRSKLRKLDEFFFSREDDYVRARMWPPVSGSPEDRHYLCCCYF